MNYKLRITIILIVLSVKTQCQTGEFNYFYHSYLFDSISIAENDIKSIFVIQYMRVDVKDTVYKEKENLYRFNEISQLICSESRYYNNSDSINHTQQTIDCFEYSDQGIMVGHKRFHENRDSAEWIQQFFYDIDKNGLISKIIVTDLSVPSNSNVIMKSYDGNNRLIKESTDFGYHSEYKYDDDGNLIEETWSLLQMQDTTKYCYDSRGNMIKIVYNDNSDIVELTREYDEQNQRIRQDERYRNGEHLFCKYTYLEDLVVIENFDINDDISSVEYMKYKDSLIESIIYKIDKKTITKEIFIYQFY